MRNLPALCLILGLPLAACMPRLPTDRPIDHPTATTAADEVMIVHAEPDPSVYEYLGEVYGEGRAARLGEATEQARTDFKENARRYHATVAIIDTNSADRNPAYAVTGTSPVHVVTPIDTDVTVVLNGRAFRPKQPSH